MHDSLGRLLAGRPPPRSLGPLPCPVRGSPFPRPPGASRTQPPSPPNFSAPPISQEPRESRGNLEGLWVPAGGTPGLQRSKVALQLVRARERSARLRVSMHSRLSIRELRLGLVTRALGALGERSQPFGASGLPAPVTSGLGSPCFSREPGLGNPGERGHHTAAPPSLPGPCQLVARGRHSQAQCSSVCKN